MNTAGYEWAARVRALNEIEVAKARAANAVCVPMSAGGGRGATALPCGAERSPRPTNNN